MSWFKTEQDYQRFRTYLRDMADRLELRDWTVHLMRESCTGTCFAQMRCIYGQKFVKVWLAEDFMEYSPERQRQTISHELIHVHFYGWIWPFNNLKQVVNRDVFSVVYGGINDGIEFGVDAMADAICKYLPLPVATEEEVARMAAEMNEAAFVIGKDDDRIDGGECDVDLTVEDWSSDA